MTRPDPTSSPDPTAELDPVARRDAVVAALGVLGSGPEERFDRITRMTQEAFGVPLTFLNLVHDEVVTTQSTYGWQQGSSVPASEQFCATTVLTPDPMVIPDTTLDPRFALAPAVAEHGIRFYAGAPLATVDGTRVGTLCVMDARPREFGLDDVALLQDLARWAERELVHVVDHRRVRHVLEGLVPEPVAVDGHDLAVLAVRSDGGDVADWRPAPDGALHLTVGSASAGGASAIVAASVRGAVVARTDEPLDAVVTGLEAQLAPVLSAAGAVVTLTHARIDPASGRVGYVGAGHGLAAVVRAGGDVEVLGARALPLGLAEDGAPRAVAELTLGGGEVLVLVSDGAVGPGVPVEALARVAASAGVDAVRALLPAGGSTHDVTVAVLRRH